MRGMNDGIDEILEQWARERPDLDVSPMAVLGRLARVARLCDVRLSQTFSIHNLDAASFDVLATLRRAGRPYRLTPTELQRSAMVTSSAIAQRLNRLETRGFIVRKSSDADGRVTDVVLTQQGLRLIEKALPAHVANEHHLLAGLSEDQKQQLASLLVQLFDSVQDN